MRLVLSTVGSLGDEVIVGFVLVKLTISLYKSKENMPSLELNTTKKGNVLMY